MSIQVEQLQFAYHIKPVLKGVSFSAEAGELLAVLGPNGAGKTTLFRCILGILSGYRGSIAVDGANVRTLSARELARRVAYIPQVHGQAFSYSVLEMVLMGTAHGMSPLCAPKAAETETALAALETLGIAELAQKSFAHLSGGEQQLVLLARALAQQARTLVMDEPTASLDYGNQALVYARVRALVRDGYTVVLSTHNPQHALWYADRVLALLCGEVAAYGTPESVVDAGLLHQLYGVQVQLVRTGQETLIVPQIQVRNGSGFAGPDAEKTK